MSAKNGRLELYSWNPRRYRVPGLRGRVTFGPRKNNFGDLLGPIIVERMLQLEGITGTSVRGQLLSVGSVLHFARPGAHVWGTGRNVKADTKLAPGLVVHAVRGPLTRRYLEEQGVNAPAIFGDPALLLPRLFPNLIYRATARSAEISVLQNLNELPEAIPGARRISAQSPVDVVIRGILESRFLVTSSLHGLIIAEAFGVPVRLVRSSHEPAFKYEDYYEGTGRRMVAPSESFRAAIDAGPASSLLRFESQPLANAFPRHLWQSYRTEQP